MEVPFELRGSSACAVPRLVSRLIWPLAEKYPIHGSKVTKVFLPQEKNSQKYTSNPLVMENMFPQRNMFGSSMSFA